MCAYNNSSIPTRQHTFCNIGKTSHNHRGNTCEKHAAGADSKWGPNGVRAGVESVMETSGRRPVSGKKLYRSRFASKIESVPIVLGPRSVHVWDYFGLTAEHAPRPFNELEGQLAPHERGTSGAQPLAPTLHQRWHPRGASTQGQGHNRASPAQAKLGISPPGRPGPGRAPSETLIFL